MLIGTLTHTMMISCTKLLQNYKNVENCLYTPMPYTLISTKLTLHNILCPIVDDCESTKMIPI